MKSKELVRQLLEADPTGECECFANGEDVYFVERLPYYYDGRQGILIRDENKKGYNILGMRQITHKDGDKIRLHMQSLEDVVWEQYDNDKLIIEGDEGFLSRAQSYKQEAIETIKKIETLSK